MKVNLVALPKGEVAKSGLSPRRRRVLCQGFGRFFTCSPCALKTEGISAREKDPEESEDAFQVDDSWLEEVGSQPR